ncbi:MAG: 2-oxoacid:acceptor oxidoreductase family protein [Bacteroidota bacterium]
MNNSKKLLIAGVGGQGIVYLTNLLVEAALLADIPVATSEIHGLAQRGGSVVAGLTFGKHTYGFVEKGGADFLIGLEPLEAQRCLPFLNKNSKAVIDDNKILPYSVIAQKTTYPDTNSFIDHLKKNIEQLIYISEIKEEIDPLLRNIFVLGRASLLNAFPIQAKHIKQAIAAIAKPEIKEKSIKAFRSGRKFKESPIHYRIKS